MTGHCRPGDQLDAGLVGGTGIETILARVGAKFCEKEAAVITAGTHNGIERHVSAKRPQSTSGLGKAPIIANEAAERERAHTVDTDCLALNKVIALVELALGGR